MQNGPLGMSDHGCLRRFEWVSPKVNTGNMWARCLGNSDRDGREVYEIVTYHTESLTSYLFSGVGYRYNKND